MLWGWDGHPWGLWGGERDPMRQQWAPMGAVGSGEGSYGAERGTHRCCEVGMFTLEGCGVGIGTLWSREGHPWELWGGERDPMG